MSFVLSKNGTLDEEDGCFIGSRFQRRTKESEDVKLIDYILKTQNPLKGKIIEYYCPSDFGMDKYNDCDDRWDCEDNNCGKCWNKKLNPEDILHTCDTCRRYGKSDHNCYYCRHKERLDLWEAKEG